MTRSGGRDANGKALTPFWKYVTSQTDYDKALQSGWRFHSRDDERARARGLERMVQRDLVRRQFRYYKALQDGIRPDPRDAAAVKNLQQEWREKQRSQQQAPVEPSEIFVELSPSDRRRTQEASFRVQARDARWTELQAPLQAQSARRDLLGNYVRD